MAVLLTTALRHGILRVVPSTKNFTQLIVNADDFGLTAGVNRAVAELSSAGALSSATLMSSGAAFAHAVSTASANPQLGIGCHIVLVDGLCCADPATIPTLADSSGHLQSSLPRFLFDLQRGRISEADVEREAAAQIDRLQSAGLRVTHLDTHKHTHLFPRLARPLLRAAMACGVPAIRNPFEQPWSASLTRGALLRKVEVAALRGFQETFRRLLRASGMRSTDGSIGVSATGRLDATTLRRLLDQAEGGTWELVCHPGYNDADLSGIRTRLRGTRDVERAALLEQIPAGVRNGRFDLIRFSDL